MMNVILTSAVAFTITFLSIPVIISIADQKKLFDIPDGRKLHKKPTASLGGVGIFCGFFFATFLAISNQANPEFQYFFAAALVIFFLGLKDDMIVLSATKKFIGQLVAAAILIHLGGIRIVSMNGLFGFEHIPDTMSIVLSYMTIILVINAYNLIDGVDGLAGTLGICSLSVFGGYFLMVHMPAYALLAFSLAGSLAAFLIFNYHPARIFMGDCGSLLIGMVNAILAIKFITIADSQAVPVPLESATAIGISILMLPLMDTIRVFSIRILKGKSPFSPDRNHIHHLLLERGLSHRHIMFSCLVLNLGFIFMAWLGRSLGSTYVLLAMALVSLALMSLLVYVIKPVVRSDVKAEIKGPAETPAIPHTKVIPFNKELAVNDNL